MNGLKRRMAVFLGLVLALTAVFSVVVQKKDVVYAVDAYEEIPYLSSDLLRDDVLIVEVGEKGIYAGDFVSYRDRNEYNFWSKTYVSGLTGVTYKCSDENVLGINQKGYLTPRAAGEVVIEVSYKDSASEFKVKVIRKFSDEGISVKNLQYPYEAAQKKACRKFIKAYGSGVTKKNRYQILEAGMNLMEACERMGTVYGIYTPDYHSYYAVAPEGIHARACLNNFKLYGNRISPFSTGYGKSFKIKSIKATKKQITINLKSKISKEQILGMAIQGMTGVKLGKSNKSIEFPLRICNADGSELNYYGVVTAETKAGSSKIIIKLTGEEGIRSGKKYRMEEYIGHYGWLDTEPFVKTYKEFKVK